MQTIAKHYCNSELINKEAQALLPSRKVNIFGNLFKKRINAYYSKQVIYLFRILCR
jgi:hypothetical protein